MAIDNTYIKHHSDACHLWLEDGELHIKQDFETGLIAIIAIHNTNLGPALGGCRFIEYPSITHAIHDATRLSKGMTYKAAAANLEMGGGKSVILKPKKLISREKMFDVFGRFVNELNGRYITALDSGTTLDDMAVINRHTAFISSKPSDGDPSPFTARGVYLGMLAAVKHLENRNDLSGLTVAIQGVGHVGYHLARHLKDAGAHLILTDINQEQLQQAAKALDAKTVGLDEIHAQNCDIFSPCALGAVLNDDTIPHIKARIIAGAANNQLAEPIHGEQIHQKGILYVPDYVINAGGLIHCVSRYYQEDDSHEAEKIKHIYNNLLTVFDIAKTDNIPTYLAADRLAESRFLK